MDKEYTGKSGSFAVVASIAPSLLMVPNWLPTLPGEGVGLQAPRLNPRNSKNHFMYLFMLTVRVLSTCWRWLPLVSSAVDLLIINSLIYRFFNV
jgi:hypothetical protein